MGDIAERETSEGNRFLKPLWLTPILVMGYISWVKMPLIWERVNEIAPFAKKVVRNK